MGRRAEERKSKTRIRERVEWKWKRKCYLSHECWNAQSSINLLQTIKVFEGSVELIK